MSTANLSEPASKASAISHLTSLKWPYQIAAQSRLKIVRCSFATKKPAVNVGGQWPLMSWSLSGVFYSMFCQLVLFTLLNFPQGTLFNRVKIRHYGFLSASSSVTLSKIRALIEISYAFEIEMPEPDMDPLPEPSCTQCGGKLIYRYSVLPFELLQRAGTG